jgi:hippurate hydrolase
MAAANDVIPDEVRLEISVRSLSPATRRMLETRIREVVELRAEFGVSANINYRYGYPVLVNHNRPTEFATRLALSEFDAARVTPEGQPLSGSEVPPTCWNPRCFLIGNGNGPGSCMVHNPAYDFNDNILKTGAVLLRPS